MTITATAAQVVQSLHSGVQKEHKVPQPLPTGAVHLAMVRVLETELEKRNLLDEKPDLLNPLWFLAETERNVYLWRNGYSLDQQDEFEFWIDLPALIQKRLKQLESFDSENPFMNPLWGLSIADKDTVTREERYLKSLFELIGQVKAHLEALSVAAAQVSREISPSAAEREIVVLPVKRQRAAVSQDS